MTTGADGLRVDVERLDPEMPLPTYAHPGDAGIDLHARESITIPSGGGRVLMPTGIAIAIPLGWAGFVLPRSGLALKHGLSVVNSPGLIDSAYRGELKVGLINGAGVLISSRADVVKNLRAEDGELEFELGPVSGAAVRLD